jgi:Domain of unknown function (DUF4157)
LQRTVGNREVEQLLKSGAIRETSLKTLQPNHPGNIASGEIGTVPPLVQEVLRSPGQPLDPATRAFIELRFGGDFGRVRVHSDAKAAESARAVSALAYTVGHNIVFGENRYAPTTHAGRELLAHELAHTIQQRNASSVLSSPEQDGIAGWNFGIERDYGCAQRRCGAARAIGFAHLRHWPFTIARR